MDKAKIEKRIRDGKGSFYDLDMLSQITGKEMADKIIEQLEEEFPEGNVTGDGARKIVRPYLIDNHKYISEMSALVINAMYKKNGVGIKATIPEYDISRENNLVIEIIKRSQIDEYGL